MISITSGIIFFSLACAVYVFDSNPILLEPPISTPGCPYRFGIFPSGSCTQYIRCAWGEPNITDCEEGLAYNDDTHSCIWPDQVPGCDSEAIVGFKCPSQLTGLSSKFYPFPRYPHPNDCQKLIVCVNDQPRLLNCGYGSAFNLETYTCDALENVPDCKLRYKNKILHRWWIVFRKELNISARLSSLADLYPEGIEYFSARFYIVAELYPARIEIFQQDSTSVWRIPDLYIVGGLYPEMKLRISSGLYSVGGLEIDLFQQDSTSLGEICYPKEFDISADSTSFGGRSRKELIFQQDSTHWRSRYPGKGKFGKFSRTLHLWGELYPEKELTTIYIVGGLFPKMNLGVFQQDSHIVGGIFIPKGE
ncbi:Protein obstructor-E like protein [Argiope bruennichi]|uniref:Protein obstructor-E like protein n=1 Tax=Argiope bruennichi TaxID=94029 RepID=A0A8T0FLF1_ARGBR|nr:Protein obstructor-E like protein [Argiope bruennichi]